MSNPPKTAVDALWTELGNVAHPSGTGYMPVYYKKPRTNATLPLIYFQDVAGAGGTEHYSCGSSNEIYTFRFEIGVWVQKTRESSAQAESGIYTISEVVYSNSKLYSYLLGKIMDDLTAARLTNTTFCDIRIVTPNLIGRPQGPGKEAGLNTELNCFDYFIEAEVDLVDV